MPEPSDYWRGFAEHLRELSVEPALAGALAAAHYRAETRATTDVDFLVRSLNGVHRRLADEGYEIKTMAEPGGDIYLVFVRGNDIRVDLIVAETEFEHEALDRALNGVITAEDVIVFKLIAWRRRDQDDIASILAAGHALDHAYIERWAEEWEVSDRWAEALRSFG